MAEVALEHVSKQYPPGVTALDELSLTTADGELLVLVGPSGSGKTTALRLIAGLESPTAGTLRIGGRPVNSLAPRQRDVALGFQTPALYPHLTVAENLAFGLRLREGGPFRRWWRLVVTAVRGASLRPPDGSHHESNLANRVAEAARTLGLADVLDRLPGQLSGGQQQRVALGRALVRRPAVFLLDEPLSNLDPGLRNELRIQLHLLQRRLRATMIYVTHDQVEALTLGDRVAVLDRGRLQQAARPLDLYQRPCNRFVAGFIGWPPMNFLAGRLRRGADGRLVVAVDGVELPLPPAVSGPEEVEVGFRPEDVAVGEASAPCDRPATGHKTKLGMVVELVEPLGATSLVTLQRDGWRLVAQVEGRRTPRERQTVEVVLDMQRAHLFDRTTGRALFHGAPSG